MSGVKVMICPGRSGPHVPLLADALRKRGGKVKIIPWFGRQAPVSWAMLALLRLAGYKVLHVNWIPFNSERLAGMTMRLSRVLGLRVVWTFHNVAPHDVRFGSEEADRRVILSMTGWAKMGVAHSARSAGEFAERYGDKLPLVVINPGSYPMMHEEVKREEARAKLGIPEDRLMALMIGPNRRNKGVGEFMDIVTRSPDNVLGVLAGSCSDPGIRGMIESRVSENPGRLRADLRFLDSLELAEYYAASDLVLMPFQRITLSGSVIEAVSQGRAVISSDQGDMRALVRNGENGYLVDSTDEAVLVLSGMTRERAEEMGRRSLMVAASLPWDDAAAEYEKAYARAMLD